MAVWRGVTDVKVLWSILEAQEEELKELHKLLETHGLDQRPTAGLRRKQVAKRSKAPVPAAPESFAGEDDGEEDSDYDAPKRSSKKRCGGGGGSNGNDTRGAVDRGSSEEQIKAAASITLNSIDNFLTSQMVYKKSLKNSTSRLSLELPCLSEGVVAAMLGPALMAKASNGKKQLQLKASLEDVDDLFGDGAFSISLRYGATLDLVSGLTFTFNKETSLLKVHGSYTMTK